MITQYKDHPLAELFPLMEDSELEELATDIRQNTQRAPITLYEGKILDGRNRYRACKIANVEPKVRHFASGDARAFVLSVNVFRRHLTTSQRALVAAKLANLSNGQKTSSANLPTSKPPVTQAEAAKELKVSERSVRMAQEVIREAPEKEIKKIERGEKTVRAVAVETKKKTATKEVVTDKLERVVPDDLVSEWQRATQVGKKLQSLAREIKSIVSEGFSGAKQDRVKDTIYAEINNSVISDAEALAWAVSSVIPYAICPTCAGHNRKNCGLCKKRGWISKFLYNSPAVSEDTKRIIERKG